MLKNTGVKRISFIDSLRGLAALYVVLYHMVLVGYKPILPNLLKPLVLSGFTGVMFFFIISAFTLCYTFEFQKKETHYLKNFYIRRIFRIVPLYYAWLIFVIIFKTGTGIEYHGLYAHRYRYFILTFFGYNFVPGEQEGAVWASWTLGVEMVFYMFFPLIIKFTNSLRRAFIFLIVSFLIAIVHYLLIEHLFSVKVIDPTKYRIYLSLFHQLPIFAIGIVCYYVYLKMNVTDLKKSLGTAMLSVGGLIFLILIYVVNGTISELLFPYVVCIPFILIFLGLSLNPVSFIVNRFTIYYGTLSFSLYLNHPTIVYRLANFYKYIYSFKLNPTVSLIICYVLTLGISTIVSVITYQLIEKPGMAFGKKLIKRMSAKSDHGKVLTEN